MSMPLRAEPCAFRHMNTIAGATDELFDVAIVLAGTGQPIGGRNRKPMDDDAQATQDERAALADTTERTQRRSDRYEEAGLGPEIRSGAISGAEAERKARDPDAPKPPSRVQQLEMQVESQLLVIETLDREVREAKSQVSEYPHEREVVAQEREVIISAQTSSIAELQTKLNDEKRRASHFQQKCMSLEAEAQEG